MEATTKKFIAQALFIKHNLEKIENELNNLKKETDKNIKILERYIKDERDSNQLKIEFPNPSKTKS